MDWCDENNKDTDKYGAGKHGYKDKDAQAGTPGTSFTSKSANALRAELMNLIEGAGLSGDGGDLTQVLAAVLELADARVQQLILNNWTGFSGLLVHDAAYGNGIWALAGRDGASAAIFSSTDGENATDRTPVGMSGAEVSSVHFASGLFVAVGDDGIWTSSDAITWTQRLGSGIFYAVTHSGSLWCAVGASGAIYTSSDGLSWTSRTPDAGFSNTFFGVAFGAGAFVAVGYNGEIQSSADGITWSRETEAGTYSGGELINDVKFGNGIFVAAGSNGQIETSPDGSTWTLRTAAGSYTGELIGVVFDGTRRWIVLGTDELQTSIDGINWEQRTPGFAPGRGGAFGDGFWLIGAGSGAGWQKSLRA